MLDSVLNRNHSFSTYEKFSEKLTFLTLWYLNVWVRIRGVRNVSFPENFAYVLNVWFYASVQQQADVEILKNEKKKICTSQSTVRFEEPGNFFKNQPKWSSAQMIIYTQNFRTYLMNFLWKCCSRVSMLKLTEFTKFALKSGQDTLDLDRPVRL